MAAASLAKGSCTLWKDKLLLDYTIEVRDEQFRVHKVVMASVSDYFRTMLTGGMVESQTDRVKLHELSPDAVLNMINYIYTGEFGETKCSTEELLGCAVYLQIPAAIEECSKVLVKKVDNVNCFDTLATLKAYSVESGVDMTSQYIKSKSSDLLDFSSAGLSFHSFQCFMDFWQKSEWELFECVSAWVDIQESRKQHLNDLMSRVRFAIMTPGQLSAIKQIEVYSESEGAWRELVSAAEAFHNVPTHLKVLNESDQSRVRQDPVPICYTADEASSSVFYSLHNTKSWKKHEAQFAPMLYDGVVAQVAVNNYLIVCDSTSSWHSNDVLIQGWHIFDPRTSAWSTMASMNVARSCFPVVHYNKHLYAIGGYISHVENPVTDDIERYDFQTNTWEVIPTKLPVCLQQHGACVIGDSIYVTGGYPQGTTYVEDFSTRLDCLNMLTNTWQSRAPSPIVKGVSSPVDDIQVMKLWGEEVLFVFKPNTSYNMHYYSPSANQWSVLDCLSLIDSDIVHSYCPYVIADQSTLYLHTFVSKKKQNSTDSSYRHARRVVAGPGERVATVKWTVGEEQKISEVKLNNFPVDIHGGLFFTALLSLPLQYKRRPRKLSTGCRSPSQ